jgi:hypothetical protein
VQCYECGEFTKQGYAVKAHRKQCQLSTEPVSVRCSVPFDLEDVEDVESVREDEEDLGDIHSISNSSLHTASETSQHGNNVSAYLNGLNNGMGPEDLHFINAYRDWGPKEPMDKLKEQARFLAACDAGVGVSDQHAQVLLDYVNTRAGIPLPKKVQTCWKNMKRVHESMCGTLQKVLPKLIRTSLSINVSILCVM